MDYGIGVEKAKYIIEEDWFIKKYNLQDGDQVRVVRSANSHENGWNYPWVSPMDKFVGATGFFRGASLNGNGILINLTEYESGWRFPYFVLEPVKAVEDTGNSQSCDEKRLTTLQEALERLNQARAERNILAGELAHTANDLKNDRSGTITGVRYVIRDEYTKADYWLKFAAEKAAKVR